MYHCRMCVLSVYCTHAQGIMQCHGKLRDKCEPDITAISLINM